MTDQKKIEEVPGDAGYKVEQFKLDCKCGHPAVSHDYSKKKCRMKGCKCRKFEPAPGRLLTREEIIEAGKKGNFDLLALQDAKTHSIDQVHEQAEKRRIKEEIEKKAEQPLRSVGLFQIVMTEVEWQSFWKQELGVRT